MESGQVKAGRGNQHAECLAEVLGAPGGDGWRDRGADGATGMGALGESVHGQRGPQEITAEMFELFPGAGFQAILACRENTSRRAHRRWAPSLTASLTRRTRTAWPTASRSTPFDRDRAPSSVRLVRSMLDLTSRGRRGPRCGSAGHCGDRRSSSSRPPSAPSARPPRGRSRPCRGRSRSGNFTPARGHGILRTSRGPPGRVTLLAAARDRAPAPVNR